MYLDITDALRAKGEEVPFRHRDVVPPQDILGETVSFDEVILEGKISMAGDDLHIWGELTTVAHGQCAGCLRPVDYPIAVSFDEIFNRAPRFPASEETDFEADECLVYEGSKVELSHLVLSLAVLELPMRFECGSDCPALAALHADEDKLTHACQKDMPDQHPFSALQQLLTKDQEV